MSAALENGSSLEDVQCNHAFQIQTGFMRETTQFRNGEPDLEVRRCVD